MTLGSMSELQRLPKCGGYMGDYSYVGDYCSIPHAVIGKYCSIGERCSIGGWQHDYSRITTSPKVYREILGKEYIDQIMQVEIGNDVWIGDNVVILKGRIGDGAVIGAGAVVTHDIPPYAIAVGNPARVIKYRFDEETIGLLVKTKWWEFDSEILIRLYDGKGLELKKKLTEFYG